MLQMLHPCRCAVLGIQPKTGEFGEKLTPPVRAAVELVVQAFRQLALKAG
jgi:hypothetical protein